MHFLLLIFSLFSQTFCAKILGVFPTPSYSHHIVFNRIMLELAKRGHEVISITTDPSPIKDKNLREINVHEISYHYWKEKFVPTLVGIDYNPVDFMRKAYKHSDILTEIQMNLPEVKELLNDKDQKFDLIFTEVVCRMAIGVSHVFKAPIIAISSFAILPDQPMTVGFPGHPLLTPHIMSLKVENHTMREKVEAMYTDFMMDQTYMKLNRQENIILKRIFGEDCPNMKELLETVDLTLINENTVFDTRAMSPSVAYIGGVHLKMQQELPKLFKDYLDNSKNGVIYMSLGTNVMPSGLHPHIKTAIIRTLSSLPYDVILKWDNDEFAGMYSNIFTVKWVPQNDLLRHPKIKLFINQGGLQSTDEAIAAHVPMVALPVLADQFKNSEKYVQLGIGAKLVFEILNEDNFRAAIEQVVGDKRYKENIEKLASQIHDQPMTPLQRAVWWTEYVLRHKGAKHLRSPLANISWFEYLVIDAALVILALVIIGIVLLVIVMNVMFKLYTFGLKGNLDVIRAKKYN